MPLEHLTPYKHFSLEPLYETHDPVDLEPGSVVQFTPTGQQWIKLADGRFISENGYVCRKTKRCEYVGFQLSLGE